LRAARVAVLADAGAVPASLGAPDGAVAEDGPVMRPEGRRPLGIAGTPWVAYAAPVVLMALAAGFVAGTAQYGAASRTVPQLIGGATMLFCALDIISRSDTPWGRRIAAQLNPAGLVEAAPAAGRHRPQRRRQGAAVAGIAGFA